MVFRANILSGTRIHVSLHGVRREEKFASRLHIMFPGRRVAHVTRRKRKIRAPNAPVSETDMPQLVPLCSHPRISRSRTEVLQFAREAAMAPMGSPFNKTAPSTDENLARAVTRRPTPLRERTKNAGKPVPPSQFAHYPKELVDAYFDVMFEWICRTDDPEDISDTRRSHRLKGRSV